jgi:hypothetical protein
MDNGANSVLIEEVANLREAHRKILEIVREKCSFENEEAVVAIFGARLSAVAVVAERAVRS